MNSFMRILLMYANEYDIKDESGRSVRGCTINYYFYGEDGSALQTQAQKVGSVGYQRAKCSLDYGARDHILRVPAIYDASFEMSVGSDGKPILKAIDLNYVQDVNFVPVPVKA